MLKCTKPRISWESMENTLINDEEVVSYITPRSYIPCPYTKLCSPKLLLLDLDPNVLESRISNAHIWTHTHCWDSK